MHLLLCQVIATGRHKNRVLCSLIVWQNVSINNQGLVTTGSVYQLDSYVCHKLQTTVMSNNMSYLAPSIEKA